ncbi:uncharacterized protein LOC110941517 [Helianthus annuus]|uniref:uncharacterized protein LOC110941517 n=1 Tax=Helianthus annuus TaxID=4232 RepID=UPI000B90421F|nr:uncharacterized protein LOC110941517 [Helianthus annuus]
MGQMGFPNKWCLLVKGILESARSAVLVNGSPTFEFQCQKGIRQGDPLSPFLFLIVKEAFSSISRDNIEKTAKLLRVFYICSGLKINLKKSRLFGIGFEGEEACDMASILGCRVGEFPFDYLGIKVGANMNKICHWDSVIDTVKRRLASWKANMLSMGSRLTLIKSVLASLPVYYLSIYKAPSKVTDLIEN